MQDMNLFRAGSNKEVVTNPSDLEMVKRDGWNLKYVKHQTPKICAAAVEQNGLALKYVKEQTPELCLTAVKEDWNA